MNATILEKLGNPRRAVKIGANRTEIVYDNGRLLQSYGTIVAANIGGKLWLAGAHDCSVTTSKHVTQWCGISSADRRKGLKDGTIGRLE